MRVPAPCESDAPRLPLSFEEVLVLIRKELEGQLAIDEGRAHGVKVSEARYTGTGTFRPARPRPNLDQTMASAGPGVPQKKLTECTRTGLDGSPLMGNADLPVNFDRPQRATPPNRTGIRRSGLRFPQWLTYHTCLGVSGEPAIDACTAHVGKRFL
jgi:hypothetical protein